MLKRKRDTCKECGHYRWIYAKGLCLYCYRKISTLKSLNRKKNTALKSGFKSEWDMFHSIWTTRPKKSFLSGKPINLLPEDLLWVNIFAHVLPKGKYPQLKYEPENIIMVLPEEHYAMDYYDQLRKERLYPECDWGKLEAYTEELKKRKGLLPSNP